LRCLQSPDSQFQNSNRWPDSKLTGLERVAGLLVTIPTALLTTTVNSDPSSLITVAADVYVGDVAPAIATPFFRHW